MQKVFGIAVIVGLIWLGLTVFTEGTDAVLAWLPWTTQDAATAEPSPLERFRAKGEAARDAALDRVRRQLDDERDAESDE